MRIARRPLLVTLLALPLLGLGLGACETPPQMQVLPQLTFANKPPLKLNVMRVDVASEYQAPLKAPNVEHLFSTSPEAAMKIWASDRLQAVGRGNTAQVLVREASVVEASLKTDKGFTGMFKKEQSERYDAVLDVHVIIRDERGMPLAQATGRVTRSRTVGEDVTLNQREQIWFEIVESLAKDLDAILERNIRDYMPAYLM
jgi:hypothetical protein